MQSFRDLYLDYTAALTAEQWQEYRFLRDEDLPVPEKGQPIPSAVLQIIDSFVALYDLARITSGG